MTKKTDLKKTLKVVQLLTFTACWALVSSCGKDSNSSADNSSGTGATCVGVGSPALALEVDKNGNGSVWNNIAAGDAYSDTSAASAFNLAFNCNHTADHDFDFRLVNNGTGCLTTTVTAVTVSKTTNYGGGAANGSAGDFTFTVPTQPSLPLAPGGSADFSIRLSNANNTGCRLGGPGGATGTNNEKVLVTVHTNDPTNPTFNATVNVFGQS